MSKNTSIIFDWNGTIINDTAQCVAAMNESLSLFGVRPVALPIYRDAYTVPLSEMYEEFGCCPKELRARESELFDVFTKAYEKCEDGICLCQGATQALEKLARKKYKLAVLSNYTKEGILKQARRFEIEGFFEEVLANPENENAFYKKSKGERLTDFIEKTQTENLVIIGDTPEEVEIARSYNAVAIAVRKGVCTKEKLQKANPDYLVSSLKEVPDIVSHLFGGDRDVA